MVKWVGYGEEDNTWEPVEHLVNSETAVNEYENIIQKKESSSSGTGIHQERKSQRTEREETTEKTSKRKYPSRKGNEGEQSL
ncbi:MAG: chromo domain-containing protein [Bacteroidota bacterium]